MMFSLVNLNWSHINGLLVARKGKPAVDKRGCSNEDEDYSSYLQFICSKL